jgi:hypothetical protein
MLSEVWDKLQLLTDFNTNLFWAIIGAVIGYVVPKVFDSITFSFKKKIQAYKMRKITEQVSDIENILEVEVLNTGNEPYTSNGINVIVKDQYFYISVPSELIPKLQNKYKTEAVEFFEFFEIHPDTGFNGEDNFNEMAIQSGISDLPELIEVARHEVANSFLNSENGLYFNASKYGIWEIDFTSKFGKKETRHLSLSLYHTDYFTFKVTQNIFKKISERDDLTKDITPNKLKKYNLFLSSFGINALLLLKDKDMGDICIFSERSILASDTDRSNVYHITMNEGLNIDDKDDLEDKVRLSNCLERGFWEELGLNNDYYAQDMTADFHDLFLVKSSFQLGISASVFIKDMSFDDLYARAEIAKDKKLEVGKLKPVIFEKKIIEKFLTDNEFIPYSKYIVARICAHKGIFLNQRNISKC